MEKLEGLRRAQLFRGHPTTTQPSLCTPFKLPSAGVIAIAPDQTVTLAADAVYTPRCATTLETTQLEGAQGGGVTSIADMKDPFHASITPQAYATGAATVIAWMLVIMLLITPRTFFVGGASGRSGLMGRRGMISGATGGGSIIGVGTRPWLQKAAALTVAVSLTLATADTFKIAERQYEEGFSDAVKLRNQVVSGMEIKVSRVISDVFLWLAQVQTLIRLFPRHKEKVIIKWVGFALILLDITFTSLNSFGPYNDTRRPGHFETAIPALSYLFQLSLSMLYAAWVMYYAITKRRYAFYHSMMWNITIVALLSMVAILTPVVFFITDISNYTIAGWGDYFRWVGAAAASVIVWEWVERIEALEREERKDGILGREIYDGDEMLDSSLSLEVAWPRSQRLSSSSDELKKPRDGGNSRRGGFTSGAVSHGFSNLAHRIGRSKNQQEKKEPRKTRRTVHIPAPPQVHRRSDSQQRSNRDSRAYVPLQSPPIVASPVSRTDTTSADSTVYTIRYHPISVSPPTGANEASNDAQLRRATPENGAQDSGRHDAPEDPEKGVVVTEDTTVSAQRARWHWQAIANPFLRRGRTPPPEVQRGRVIEPLGVEDVTANIPSRNYSGWALKERLGTFAAQQGERLRSKKVSGQQSEQNLPVTIIPAQPRGRTWSPQILNQQQEILGQEQSGLGAEVSTSTGLHVSKERLETVIDSVESTGSSSTSQPNSVFHSADAEHQSPSNRNSHVRFAPETFSRSLTQSATEVEPSQHLSTVALGNEVRNDQASSVPAPIVRGSTADSTVDRNHTQTNHDR